MSGGPGSRFVEVPAEALRKALASWGFRQGNYAGREETWIRAHDKSPWYSIRVYTSIEQGSKHARSCGADAIRVSAGSSHTGQIYGARVFRTGTVEGVIERLHQRCREAYAAINKRPWQRSSK